MPFSRLARAHCARKARAALRTRRLFLEPLEARRVLATNLPPTIELPIPMPAAIEDVHTPIPGLVISDPDAGNGVIQVKLQVAVGQFSATPAGTSSVTGSGTSALTLMGNERPGQYGRSAADHHGRNYPAHLLA
jgi:hypothetical protein